MALVHIISSCGNDVFLTAHNLEKCACKLYLRNEIMKTKQLVLESQKQMNPCCYPQELLGGCAEDPTESGHGNGNRAREFFKLLFTVVGSGLSPKAKVMSFMCNLKNYSCHMKQ